MTAMGRYTVRLIDHQGQTQTQNLLDVGTSLRLDFQMPIFVRAIEVVFEEPVEVEVVPIATENIFGKVTE